MVTTRLQKRVFLAIPAYREAGRLPRYLIELRATLESADFATTILVIDDGSPAADREALAAQVEPGVSGTCEIAPMLALAENTRKGGAVLAGWRSIDPDAADWFAFVDADGAIPAREVRRVLEAVVSGDDATAAAFAVRRVGAGHEVVRGLGRSIAGRVFSTLAARVAGHRVSDTQCGFKILPAPAWTAIAPRMRGNGLCFDVELLAALTRAGVAIVEFPIDWRAQRGGHVCWWRDGGGMLRQLLRLRRQLRDEAGSTSRSDERTSLIRSDRPIKTGMVFTETASSPRSISNPI